MQIELSDRDIRLLQLGLDLLEGSREELITKELRVMADLIGAVHESESRLIRGCRGQIQHIISLRGRLGGGTE